MTLELTIDKRIETCNLTEQLNKVLDERPHIYLEREKNVFEEAKSALKKRKIILWIEGVMGCGKSTLAKKLAEHLDLECFLENPEHHVIAKDLAMLYSGVYEIQCIGAENINQHYLGFRMSDYCEALRRSRSVVLDRISHADDLYMTGFVADKFMTQEQVDAIRRRRNATLAIYKPTNTLTAPIEIVVQLVGEPELFFARKNHRAREVEKATDEGSGVALDYIKRLAGYYQKDPGLAKLLADVGYKGPLIILPQQITEKIEYDPSNLRHLVPLLETITKYAKS